MPSFYRFTALSLYRFESDYLYGVGRIGGEQGSAWSYHLGDALGSVRLTTNITGTLTGHAHYEPFGEVLAGSTVATPFGFAGEQADVTGLQYLRARYYAPGQGRFTQVDQFEGDILLPQSLTPYGYVHNNPLRYVDPSGRSRCDTLVREVKDWKIVTFGDDYHRQCQEARDLLDKTRAPGSFNGQRFETDLGMLIAWFADDELPGETAEERFDFVLWYTNITSDPNLNQPVPPTAIAARTTHFRGAYEDEHGNEIHKYGDTGFREEFRDSHIWPTSSNQVGHFLTAAHLGYLGAFPSCVVGHEKVSDQIKDPLLHCFHLSYAAGARGDYLGFFLGFAQEAETAEKFLAAVSADQGIRRLGPALIDVDSSLINSCRVEDLTQEIFRGDAADKTTFLEMAIRYSSGMKSPKTEWPYGGRGNSLQDMRLTVKGWGFGELIKMRVIATRQQAIDWLKWNLGDASTK